MKQEQINFLIIAIIAGALAGALTSSFFLTDSDSKSKSNDDLIWDFYSTETATLISPHGLRKAMDKGQDNFILVDLRSQEEYENSHIVGSINIPAYKDPDTSAYGDKERIISSFAELPEDKEVIVYCYSIPCMTGRKIGKMLADNDIFVKELGIGWNEWRYDWNGWNHEHEWAKTNVLDYIVSGPEPGELKTKSDSSACPIDNEFGC